MTPSSMPTRSGVRPPRPRRHPDECRCLDCIDWDGKPLRVIRPGVTADRAYRAALRTVGVR